ncbi:MAG TPA: cation diffusion facilitator family transporter [Vicinamibacterales bacterium]
MSNAHAHGPHAHGRDAGRTRRLALTLVLVCAYTGAEVIGGLVSGSLALLADAGHMFSDAAALTLTLIAIRVAQRPPTDRQTYGYQRAEILAALVNGATLLAIAFLIVLEAIERLREPRDVQSTLMLTVAAGGLAVNLASLWLLRGHERDDLNLRGAWLHVLTDALGSVQALVAGLLIRTLGWTWTDPLASILIALLIVFSAWSLVRKSVLVLMEAAPAGLDMDAVRATLAGVPGVAGVHDLHVWTIGSGLVALSAHLVVPEGDADGQVLADARLRLRERFGIRHVTLQLDRNDACTGEVHR